MDPEDRRRRRWQVLSALVIGGCGLTLVGWTMEGYLQQVLLQVGTTLALAGPLVFAGQVLGGRLKASAERIEVVANDVEDTRREVDQTRRELEASQASLDELSDLVRRDLDASREDDATAWEKFEADPSVDNLANQLARARQLDAIDAYGIRVKIRPTELRLRFQATLRDVSTDADTGEQYLSLPVTIENPDGEAIEQLVWDSGQPPAEFLGMVTRALERMAVKPDEREMDPARLLRDALATLRVAVESRTASTGSNFTLGTVVEILDGGWVLTEEGLGHITDRVRLNSDAVRSHTNRDLMEEQLEMSARSDFRGASMVASQYHQHALADKLRALRPNAPDS